MIWTRQRSSCVPQLPTSRTLCKGMSISSIARDHDIEYHLTFLGKIQEKRNQNNQNVEWISAEARDDGRNINIVTYRGDKTGSNTLKKYPVQHQWVKKNIEPHQQFHARKEKEKFKEARHDFLKKNVASTSIMQRTQKVQMYKIPSSMDHTSEVQPLEKVSNVKNLLQSCVKLLNHPSSVKILQNLLERCNT